MNDNNKKNNNQELPKLKDDKKNKTNKKDIKTGTKKVAKKTTSSKNSTTKPTLKKKNTTKKQTSNTKKINKTQSLEKKIDTKKDNLINIDEKEIKATKINNENIDKKEEIKDKQVAKDNDTIKETTPKKIKSPKSKKEVIKETTKKIPNEKIIINDNNTAKDKNFKNELKDINSNKEFAKAIWDTDDITSAIKIEENNQEKLNNEIDELLIKERKYNFFEPFIVIILLILCFLGLYFILFTKDSAIINSALTNVNTNLTNTLTEFNTIKEELNKGITGMATLDTTSNDYASFKDYTYNFNLYNKNNNYYGDIELKKEDKDIINTYSYLNKNLYISTPLYYYPIQINNPIKVNPLSINYSNLNNNIEVIKNYLINNIKYTSSKKEKEDLNGEKLNVLNLEFSEYDFNNSIQSILNAIAKDSELLKSISKNLGLDEVTVNDLFNTNVNFKGNYQIKIYTKGILQTFYGIKVYNDDKEILEYLTDGSTTLNIYDKKRLSINLSDNKLLIYVDDIKLIDIKSNKNKNDLINLDFQVSNILNNYQGSLMLTKYDNNKGNFLFSFKDTNNNDISMEIKMDLSFGENKDNTFDYTDAILLDDITEDEIKDMKNKLINAIWEPVNGPDNTTNNDTE